MEYSLPTQLGIACQIFLQHAYPGGSDTIPPARLAYIHIADHPVEDFLPPARAAEGIAQTVSDDQGATIGYTFRLGCTHFPHLKLKTQQIVLSSGSTWLYSVDTHDAFSKESVVPPADHPDAAAWADLQRANRILKEQIESAWEAADIFTFRHLLRAELTAQPGDQPA